MFVIHNVRLISCLGLIFLIAFLFSSIAHSENSERGKAAYAAKFASAINASDIDELSDMFNIKAFGDKVSRQLYTDKKERKDFSKEISKQEADILSGAFVFVFQQQGKATFKDVLDNGRPLISVSFDNGGIDYFELILNETESGFQVTDLFVLSTGKLLSDVMVQNIQIILAPSSSLLARALGVKKIDKKTVARFKSMGELMTSGDFEGAYKIVQSFPEDVRNSRAMLDRAIVLSQRISDEEYQKQLGLLAKHHGDSDTTQFMLIDYYVLQGEHGKALRNINGVIDRYGEDAGNLYVKGNMQFLMEDYSLSSMTFDKVVKLDPENIDALDSLITSLVLEERFDAVVARLKQIENDNDVIYENEDFNDESGFYDAFKQSEAYKAWMN